MLPPTTPPNEPATLKISGGNLTSTRETATTTPQRPSEPATLKISGSNISSTRESTSTTTSTVTTSPEPVWVTLKDRKPTVVEGHYAKSGKLVVLSTYFEQSLKPQGMVPLKKNHSLL